MSTRHLTFSPYTDAARAFVFSTFARSIGVERDKRLGYEHALKRVLRDPSAKAVVVHPAHHPEELFGWAVSLPESLIYVYVRWDYRRGKLATAIGAEGKNIGSQLIKHVDGVWTSVPAALWTMDASRMAEAGYPIRYDLQQHDRFQQLAKR